MCSYHLANTSTHLIMWWYIWWTVYVSMSGNRMHMCPKWIPNLLDLIFNITCWVCKLLGLFNSTSLCFGLNLIFRCLKLKHFIIMSFSENFKTVVATAPWGEGCCEEICKCLAHGIQLVSSRWKGETINAFILLNYEFYLFLFQIRVFLGQDSRVRIGEK